MSQTLYVGIDFGTSKSSVAWFNPRTGQAEILLNAEGQQTTPSVVYFGEDEPLVGGPAEDLLDDEQERRHVVVSVKRNLVQTPLLWLGGKPVKAIEVAAAILKKLKRDAEDLHFHEPVRRAVITCPASFNVLQRDKIAEAGQLAGFTDVILLDEPIAAALAYTHAGLTVGNRVLVYDLGGGTFDVALLARKGDSWELALPPKGLDHCGGDDFDRSLYDYCEERAYAETGGTISQDGLINLSFLRLCRQRKEHLSSVERATFSTLVQADGRMAPVKQTIDRATFEGLIDPRVQTTVRLTGEMVVEAAGEGIDTVVLVGGSSKVPLVQRELTRALPVAPQRWHQQDVAVALGAAYHAHTLWGAPQQEALPEVTREAEREEPRDAESERESLEGGQDVGFGEAVGAEPENVGIVDRNLFRPVATWKLQGPWSLFALSPDGRLAACAARTGGVELRDVAHTGEVVRSLSKDDHTISMAFSPGGHYMAYNKSSLSVVWITQVDSGKLALDVGAGFSSTIWRIAYPTDDWLYGLADIGRKHERQIVRWNLHTKERSTVASPQFTPRTLAVSSAGDCLATAGSGPSGYGIELWQASTGALLKRIPDVNTGGTALAFSPDGRRLASVGSFADPAKANPTITIGGRGLGSIGSFEDHERTPPLAVIWDVETGKPLCTLEGHTGPVLSAAFSLDGKLLATGAGGDDGTVIIWDAPTGEQVQILPQQGGPGSFVAFGPDGRLVVGHRPSTGQTVCIVTLWERTRGAKSP